MTDTHSKKKLYLYTIPEETGERLYDMATLAACLQGLFNREHGPRLYFLSPTKNTPRYWLNIFTAEDEWLSDREIIPVESMAGLIGLAGSLVKTAIIWDPEVPASYNAAFTAAGVQDGVVLSPGYANEMLPLLSPGYTIDMRGMFTGSQTGSAKNDAYIWAVEHFLSRGMCAEHWLCLYSDPFMAREQGDISYVVTRDWSIYNRAFVFDLSPWGDELPLDDPGQPLGRDLETYKLILQTQRERNGGRCMTEITGFFTFDKYSNTPRHKSSHEPVYTEWESVYVMSAYNCYQNTAAHDCFNQSLHSQFSFRPLRQPRPEPVSSENACYLGILMADYDSALPLYEFLPKFWDDPKRGELPFAWGINPNLIETYPDIISYLYRTAVPGMDVITADASAAGYFNPSRIRAEDWDMVEEHNRRFYEMTDVTISPMVLDWEPLKGEALDRITGFSPDGVATIIVDLHVLAPDEVGYHKSEIVHNGVIVEEMFNQIFNPQDRKAAAQTLADLLLAGDTGDAPAFHFIRIVWQSPSAVSDILNEVKRIRPDLDIRLLNTYNYFRLHKENMLRG